METHNIEINRMQWNNFCTNFSKHFYDRVSDVFVEEDIRQWRHTCNGQVDHVTGDNEPTLRTICWRKVEESGVYNEHKCHENNLWIMLIILNIK